MSSFECMQCIHEDTVHSDVNVVVCAITVLRLRFPITPRDERFLQDILPPGTGACANRGF